MVGSGWVRLGSPARVHLWLMHVRRTCAICAPHVQCTLSSFNWFSGRTCGAHPFRVGAPLVVQLAGVVVPVVQSDAATTINVEETYVDQDVGQTLRLLGRPLGRLGDLQVADFTQSSIRVGVIECPPPETVQVPNELYTADLQQRRGANGLTVALKRLVGLDPGH